MTISRLDSVAKRGGQKLLHRGGLPGRGAVHPHAPVLVVLAAGKGTRFGQDPKCIQALAGRPVACHSMDAFRRTLGGDIVCVVGHRYQDVVEALGPDHSYVLSDNPTGGTAYATFEALGVPGLIHRDALVVVTMGDRVVPDAVFARLAEAHFKGEREADLTLLTATYKPPGHRGRGRILRDAEGRVMRIVEQRDIDAEPDVALRRELDDITEANCPLYMIRQALLDRCLAELTNDNAQGQFYLTDIVQSLRVTGGDVRAVTTTEADPAYELLCSDVTRPVDLERLESIMCRSAGASQPDGEALAQAADIIAADRPGCQTAAIAWQLSELYRLVLLEQHFFRPDQPIGIGVCGGRLRIAFMHPDMTRFYGPAWQMPTGAGAPSEGGQIVMITQASDDHRLHFLPVDPIYRESVGSVSADMPEMHVGPEVSDSHTYETFGTLLSHALLGQFGYVADAEVMYLHGAGQPLPPEETWTSNNLRRPFPLLCNALASLRTVREGVIGGRVQERLSADSFEGLRLASTGNIPKGGFSSSSAFTLAMVNATHALLELGIPDTTIVNVACQAEYGTGVRAGSLDQATVQCGKTGKGTLLSSNPRENYRTLGTYGVPHERITILFPYSVPRDRDAWRWSCGAYGDAPDSPCLTTGEVRKLTGKAAELAAVLLRLPLHRDFFQEIEAELLPTGELTAAGRCRVCDILVRVPLLVRVGVLRQEVLAARDWYADQLACTQEDMDEQTALAYAEELLAGLFSGWREPVFRRTAPDGTVHEEVGVPLRAMLGYLFAEVTKNMYLIHHPDAWIPCVSASQLGDCCVALDAARLPSRRDMERELPWECDCHGPARLERWLKRFGATPFDYQRGLDDMSLAADPAPDIRLVAGTNFFRGLPLIDLAGAMLKRAFGDSAVAVRVNAAGQGDYFQVHVDRHLADPDEVKEFLRLAFHRRFGLDAEHPFVVLHPGGGAAAVRLARADQLPALVERLRRLAPSCP